MMAASIEKKHHPGGITTFGRQFGVQPLNAKNHALSFSHWNVKVDDDGNDDAISPSLTKECSIQQVLINYI